MGSGCLLVYNSYQLFDVFRDLCIYQFHKNLSITFWVILLTLQPFYGSLDFVWDNPGEPVVVSKLKFTYYCRYQKKHSPTHTYLVINHPLSASSIYYDPWHPTYSIYVPDSLFAQSVSKFSLVYLFAWHPPLHTPYISAPNCCLLFAAHVHTTATCFAVVPRLCPLILLSLSLSFSALYSLQELYVVYVVELSLAISMSGASGSDSRLSYKHSVTLQSPATTFSGESCLQLLYTALSPLIVKLVCVTHSGTYNERILYSNQLPLGLATHKMKLPLSATASEHRNCSLAFQVDAVTTGVVAAISNITVLPGHCPSAS